MADRAANMNLVTPARMLVLLLAVSACSPVKLYAPPETTAELPHGLRPQNLDTIGLGNHRRLAETPCYPHAPCGSEPDPDYVTPDGQPLVSEWKWNTKQDFPPQLCLALSGGGLRSATFGLGVLKGLHEAKQLHKIDVASSVSGGGYILSWYVAQKYFGWKANCGEGLDDENLFALRGTWMEYLRQNSEFFTAGHASLPLAIAVFPGIPLNLVANGLFGLHMNASFLYNAYAQRLQQVYHSPPCTEGDCPPGPDIDMMELGKFMKCSVRNRNHKDEDTFHRKLRPPLFVFNSTALIDDAAGPRAGLLQNTVFEFTPFQYGSAALGRYQYQGQERQGEPLAVQRTWGLHEIVAFSGAAFDFNKFTNHPSLRQIATAFNLDLGRYIPNPRLKRSAKQIAHWVSPLAHLFGRPHYARDADGTHIYLSDGGHSENLGAFSLVRRLCREIIIVDAEEDTGYGYDAYFKLKGALEREMGVELKIPEIEDRRRQACENRLACNGSEKLPPQDQDVWRGAAADPLSEGWIKYLPYRHPDSCPTIKQQEQSTGAHCTSDSIRVLYLKLAYHPNPKQDFKWKNNTVNCIAQKCNTQECSAFEKLENSLRCTFEETAVCTAPTQEGCNAPFPQLPTRVQSMSPEHFDAYRNLGCKLALGPLAQALGVESLGNEEIAQHCLDMQPGTSTLTEVQSRSHERDKGNKHSCLADPCAALILLCDEERIRKPHNEEPSFYSGPY